MGIIGPLPLLKDITCDVHLRSFSGKVAAIDVYCWLHKTVIFYVEEIPLGIEKMWYVSTLHSYMCLSSIGGLYSTHCDANELDCLSSLLIGGEGFPKVNEVPLNWKSEICENEGRVSSEAFGRGRKYANEG